jgi:hypothetical protein
MPEIEVTILNWEKYHPRKDVSNPSWFRFQNRVWNDSQFHSFSAEERWIWVCLLSIASQKNTAKLEFSTEWLSVHSGASVATIENALEKLSRNACVTCTLRPRTQTLRSRTQTLRPRDVRGRNITRHNKTDITEQDITKEDITKTFCSEVLETNPSEPTEKEESLLNKTSELVRKKILELYTDSEFISGELKKMEIWLATNPERSPKSQRGWSNFVSKWLSRGWEQYRKSIPSKPVEPQWPKVYHEELWKPVGSS